MGERGEIGERELRDARRAENAEKPGHSHPPSLGGLHELPLSFPLPERSYSAAYSFHALQRRDSKCLAVASWPHHMPPCVVRSTMPAPPTAEILATASPFDRGGRGRLMACRRQRCSVG